MHPNGAEGLHFVARDESKSCVAVCFQGLDKHSRRVRRRFVRGSREISLVHRASVDALIATF